jgi:2-oxoglutarate ferredoxin oxidoreductase subunit delta
LPDLLSGKTQRRSLGETSLKGKIRIKKELCKGCGLCIEACPKGSIFISKKINEKSYFPAEFDKENEEECTGCGLCAVMCPEAVIEVYREKK